MKNSREYTPGIVDPRGDRNARLARIDRDKGPEFKDDSKGRMRLRTGALLKQTDDGLIDVDYDALIARMRSEGLI